MARRKPELPAYVCGDCAHLVPDMEYLSVKDHRPILGRCPYSRCGDSRCRIWPMRSLSANLNASHGSIA